MLKWCYLHFYPNVISGSCGLEKNLWSLFEQWAGSFSFWWFTIGCTDGTVLLHSYYMLLLSACLAMQNIFLTQSKVVLLLFVVPSSNTLVFSTLSNYDTPIKFLLFKTDTEKDMWPSISLDQESCWRCFGGNGFNA